MRNNMVEKIKALWIKYEEIIAYLIVGGLTTVVSLSLIHIYFNISQKLKDTIKN